MTGSHHDWDVLGSKPAIAVRPHLTPNWVRDAVRAGGGQIVALEDADALVWFSLSPDGLDDDLARAPRVRWVALPAAGVEEFASMIDDRRVWTAAKGVFAEPVAEHALALVLAGLRGIGQFARANRWSTPSGRLVHDARVTVVGGGGVGSKLAELLGVFRAEVTIVRRHATPVAGCRVLPSDRFLEALPDADAIVLAAALTPETVGMIGRRELDAMAPSAWLVNVSRGRLVVTDELVDALRGGSIAGAGLDVTDPEPLPPDHPLWRIPNCIITPHTANTPEMHRPRLARHLIVNVRRYESGRPLEGVVDPDAGY